jgi:hypothetical protein
MIFRVLAAAVIAWTCAGNAIAADPPPENTGPNANLLRWARGVYLYRTISDHRERGREQWQLFVYRDGSRSIVMMHDFFAMNAQVNGLARVDKAFATFYTEGKFKGAVTISFDRGGMDLVSTGSQGAVHQHVATPETFSISLHPVASDWWHYWYYDRAKKGPQISRYYSLEASRDLGLPVTVRLIETEQEEAGEETVTVPAGTFPAVKFASGNSAAWLTGPDSMLVKSVSPKADREYLLESFESGPK